MQKQKILTLLTAVAISTMMVYAADKKAIESKVVTLAMLEQSLKDSPTNFRQWMDLYRELSPVDKNAGQKAIEKVYPTAFKSKPDNELMPF